MIKVFFLYCYIALLSSTCNFSQKCFDCQWCSLNINVEVIISLHVHHSWFKNTVSRSWRTAEHSVSTLLFFKLVIRFLASSYLVVSFSLPYSAFFLISLNVPKLPCNRMARMAFKLYWSHSDRPASLVTDVPCVNFFVAIKKSSTAFVSHSIWYSWHRDSSCSKFVLSKVEKGIL